MYLKYFRKFALINKNFVCTGISCPRTCNIWFPISKTQILRFNVNTIFHFQAPRAEAMSMLGALISFPRHYGDIPALQPHSKDMTILNCSEIKVSYPTVNKEQEKKHTRGALLVKKKQHYFILSSFIEDVKNGFGKLDFLYG